MALVFRGVIDAGMDVVVVFCLDARTQSQSQWFRRRWVIGWRGRRSRWLRNWQAGGRHCCRDRSASQAEKRIIARRLSGRHRIITLSSKRSGTCSETVVSKRRVWACQGHRLRRTRRKYISNLPHHQSYIDHHSLPSLHQPLGTFPTWIHHYTHSGRSSDCLQR